MDKVPEGKQISRRSFLKLGATAAAGAALASLPGDAKSIAQPVQVDNKLGKRQVGEKNEEPVAVETEVPKAPRYAQLEDLLGVGYTQARVNQEEGQQNPPQDVENGPGLFVSSRMEGMDVPVTDQEGPTFYRYGHKGDATQGGTAVGESGGVVAVQGTDKEGSGADVSTWVDLGTNQDGQQALMFSMDNAFYALNEDKTINPDWTLDPDRAVIIVEGQEGKMRYVLERGGSKGDLGWQFIIPLGGMQPQIGEGIDRRNVTPSLPDTYRTLTKMTISLQEDGKQNLTFNFEKKAAPEPRTQG